MIRATTGISSLVLWCALAVGVASCASLSVTPQGPIEFEVSARFALRHGDEALSARVTWRHGGDSDEMLITNPIGQGVARITRAGQVVTLENAEKRRYEATNAEDLTEQILGWRLPLTGLVDWIRARPRPGIPHEIQMGDNKLAARLFQEGWNIEYQEYDGSRPARMRLSRPGLEIRLFIESWREVAAQAGQ